AALLAGAWLALPPKAMAGAWVNRRGGYGGGWVNRYGGGGGGWINRGGGGGGWINRRGYGGGGGWGNRRRAPFSTDKLRASCRSSSPRSDGHCRPIPWAPAPSAPRNGVDLG